MPASLKLLLAAKKVASVVFAKWPGDQRYYTVTVLDIDEKNKQCKIQYEDGYQCWTDTKEMHLQLAVDDLEDEHIICCVCDSGHSKAPNEIVICDVCQQGYHVKCHQPAIDREEDNLDDADAEWNCSACKHLLAQDNRQPLQSPPKSAKKAPMTGKVAKTPSKGRRGSSSSPKSSAKITPKKTPSKKTSKTDQKPRSAVKKSNKPDSSLQAKIKLATLRQNCDIANQVNAPEETSKDVKAELAVDADETAIDMKKVGVNTSEFVGLISPAEPAVVKSSRRPSSKLAAAF